MVPKIGCITLLPYSTSSSNFLDIACTFNAVINTIPLITFEFVGFKLLLAKTPHKTEPPLLGAFFDDGNFF